ncbi:MAG: hypothetical protein M3O71_03905 [Bacteroidota bacterium]|nr:hypothetical protein [Bacteroidota bacterium]
MKKIFTLILSIALLTACNKGNKVLPAKSPFGKWNGDYGVYATYDSKGIRQTSDTTFFNNNYVCNFNADKSGSILVGISPIYKFNYSVSGTQINYTNYFSVDGNGNNLNQESNFSETIATITATKLTLVREALIANTGGKSVSTAFFTRLN